MRELSMDALFELFFSLERHRAMVLAALADPDFPRRAAVALRLAAIGSSEAAQFNRQDRLTADWPDSAWPELKGRSATISEIIAWAFDSKRWPVKDWPAEVGLPTSEEVLATRETLEVLAAYYAIPADRRQAAFEALKGFGAKKGGGDE